MNYEEMYDKASRLAYEIFGDESSLRTPEKYWDECHYRKWQESELWKEWTSSDWDVEKDLPEDKKYILLAACCLGSYCVEESFTWLLAVKGLGASEALKILGIKYPSSPFFSMNHYNTKWSTMENIESTIRMNIACMQFNDANKSS